MVLTRAQNQPGPDGKLGTSDDVQNAANTDSPWVDQSQTYSSHASHQVFLREYVDNAAGRPGLHRAGCSAGWMPGRPTPGPRTARTGLSTWAAVKKQAADLLGIQLRDRRRDQRADDRDRPLRQVPAGAGPRVCRSSSPSTAWSRPTATQDGGKGTPVPNDVLHFDTPFLTDIAHNADPSSSGHEQRRPAGHAGSRTPTTPRPRTSRPAAGHLRRRDARTRTSPVGTAGATRTSRSARSTRCSTPSTTGWSPQIEDVLSTTPAARPGSPTGSCPMAPAPDPTAGTASGSSRRHASSTRWSTSTWCSSEFARKVAPGIPAFDGYSPDVNPAISDGVRAGGLPVRSLDARRGRRAQDRGPGTGAVKDDSIPCSPRS